MLETSNNIYTIKLKINLNNILFVKIDFKNNKLFYINHFWVLINNQRTSVHEIFKPDAYWLLIFFLKYDLLSYLYILYLFILILYLYCICTNL